MTMALFASAFTDVSFIAPDMSLSIWKVLLHLNESSHLLSRGRDCRILSTSCLQLISAPWFLASVLYLVTLIISPTHRAVLGLYTDVIMLRGPGEQEGTGTLVDLVRHLHTEGGRCSLRKTRELSH